MTRKRGQRRLRLLFTSPLTYLGLFFIAIFSFAEAYHRMPGELYAPYVKLEPAAQEDLKRICGMLSAIINGNREAPRNPKGEIVVNGDFTVVGDLDVSLIGADVSGSRFGALMLGNL